MQDIPILSVSLAELRQRGVILQVGEAVAVLLAIGDRLGWRTAPPPLAALILRSDGTVDVQHSENEQDESISAEPYARLLDRLLPAPGGPQGSVPGGIRVLIARATGQTELPPVIGAHQFASQLRRFAPASIPDAIVAIMLRWADADEPDQPARPDEDRRQAGPTASQLRSFLHEGDLERYAMRQRLAHVTPYAAARMAELALASAQLPSSYSIFVPPTEARERRHRGRTVAAVGALVAITAWAGTSPWLRHQLPHDLVDRLRALSVAMIARDTADAPVQAVDASSGAAPDDASALSSGTAVADSGPRGSAAFAAPGTAATDAASGAGVYPAATHTTGTGAPADVATVAASTALAAHPLRTTSSSTFSPTFGFDSRSIFFHAETPAGSRLVRAATNERGVVVSQATLLDDGAQNYHVRPSPDGRFLAFDSDRDGQRGVYLADPDGRNIRRVSGSGYAAIPSWSPDGRHLAFVRGDADRPNIWNLWVLDVISGDERQFTHYGSGQVWPGNWFTDGRRIAFTHETTLFVLDTVTGGLRGYESPIRGRLLRTPAVAPDDQHVAFQVSRDGMWILDTFTHRMRRVLSDPSAEDFSWSRDGRRLAFHRRQGGQWGVWVMPAPTDTAQQQ